MLALLLLSTLIDINICAPESCFYSQRVTFFTGNTVASPQRLGGYSFDVGWNSPQPSIINSSLLYTLSKNTRHVFLNFVANIVSTTYTSGTIMINPTNGSQILSITMTIVLLKSCQGTARLILFQVSFLQLGVLHINSTINTGINFQGSTTNYKSQVFVTDFNGYPINGSLNYGFYSWLRPVALNCSYQIMSLLAIPGEYSANYTYMNRLRYTYVLVDISTFFITPVTQIYTGNWISGQASVYVSKDFMPYADQKCMLGIKAYMLVLNIVQNYSMTLSNSSNFSLIYLYKRYPGNNLIPSLFCLGFCKQGTGPSNISACVSCPQQYKTCSNTSYALTCHEGYYPQPTVIGVQKCYPCMLGCSICTNHTYCIECLQTNLRTEQNNCEKCLSKNWLAGGICSSIPGCSRAQSVHGRSVCQSCNPQEHFQIDPIDQNCVCKSGYALKDGECIDHCGDGIIINQECDDNNTINNDGCSYECKEQKGYKCKRKTMFSPSECVFEENVSIELVSIKRINFQNKIVLVFRILPEYFSGLSPEFIRGTFQTNLSVSIESVTVEGKFITVEMAFDEDIEAKQAQFSMNFNDLSVAQKQVSLLISFRADQKLVKILRIKLAKTIKNIFQYTIICVIIVFLVSLRFHKMIGLETIIPFQITYFLFLLTKDKTQIFSLFQYYAGSALNFLFYFNGQPLVSFSPQTSTLLSNNQKFTLIFVYCFSFTTFSLSLLGFTLYFIKGNQSICHAKFEKIAVFWHNRVSLPIFSWFLIPLFVLKSTLSNDKKQVRLPHSLLVFQCLMMILIISFQWRAAFSLKSSFVQSIKKQQLYIPAALGFLLMISLLLSVSAMGLISFFEPWLLSLYSLSLIFFIYIRPYEGALNNVGVIIGLIQIIFFLIWGILRRSNPSVETQENQLFGLLISFGLAAANIIIGALRVFFEALQQYRQNSKQQGKADSSLQKEKGTDISVKQAVVLQARYDTNIMLPHHLKHINVNFIESIPFEHFNPIHKQKDSQLKKYLMQRINTKKKPKLSIQN